MPERPINPESTNTGEVLDPLVRSGLEALLSGHTQPVAPAQRPQASDSLGIFRQLVNPTNPENLERSNAMSTLDSMVKILRKPQLLKALNFDETNMISALQAIFSQASGRRMTDRDIYQMLRSQTSQRGADGRSKMVPTPIGQILFAHVLRLQQETDPAIIQKRTDHLVAAFKEMEPSVEQYRLIDATMEILKAPRKGKTFKEDLASRGLSIPSQPLKFDEAKIQQMIETAGQIETEPEAEPQPEPEATPEAEPETGSESGGEEASAETTDDTTTPDGAAATTPDNAEVQNPTIDYEAFLGANADSFPVKLFSFLHKALTATEQDYDANYKAALADMTQNQLADRINQESGLDEGLGDALWTYPASGNGDVDMIKCIAESYGITDADGLTNKLSELHRAVAPSFAMALNENDPIRQAYEEANKPIDFDAFFEEFRQIPENTYQLYLLRMLFAVLHVSEADFDTHYRKEYCNGEDIGKVKTRLQNALGADYFAKILATAEGSTDYKKSLLKAIAEYCNVGNDTEQLKVKVREVYQTVGMIYPDLLYQGDPIKTA